jgi:hypothetical protein
MEVQDESLRYGESLDKLQPLTSSCKVTLHLGNVFGCRSLSGRLGLQDLRKGGLSPLYPRAGDCFSSQVRADQKLGVSNQMP